MNHKLDTGLYSFGKLSIGTSQATKTVFRVETQYIFFHTSQKTPPPNK